MYLFCITLTFISLLSSGLAANCYGPASKLAVTQFDAFPSPVSVGETLFIRANIAPTYNMGSAKVDFSVYYTDNFDVTGLTPIIDIPALEFCDLSTSITCPLTNGTHILQWEYRVPDILPGTYQVRYTILEDSPPDDNPYSCIQFSVTVQGQQANQFTSWYQATLLGTALFTQDDYKLRTLGENLQVGPIGPIYNGSVSPPAYGIIKYLTGSGDLVPNSYYDTSSFVWGLSGSMIKQSIGAKTVSHVYHGTCYLGYINSFYPNVVGYMYNYTTPLIEGTFTLTWTYTDSNVAQISGTAEFQPDATIPYGWGFPLLYGRLGTHQVVTSDIGFLQIQGNLPFCTSGVCASPPAQGGSGGGLSSDKLGLAIGLPIAVVFILVVAFAAFVYYKKKTVTEQEDGVFAVSRKPEYGSALVVDGIIEETMGSKTMQAMLDMRDEDVGSGEESEEESERALSRTRSRSRTHSRSRSRSRSAERSGSESDPGESASRGSDDD